MNEQKNLFLAIAISIAIIVFFQLLFPTPISEPIQNAENEVLAPATSIDEPIQNTIEIIKPKEDVLAINERVTIQTPSLTGSINLISIANILPFVIILLTTCDQLPGQEPKSNKLLFFFINLNFLFNSINLKEARERYPSVLDFLKN